MKTRELTPAEIQNRGNRIHQGEMPAIMPTLVGGYIVVAVVWPRLGPGQVKVLTTEAAYQELYATVRTSAAQTVDLYSVSEALLAFGTPAEALA